MVFSAFENPEVERRLAQPRVTSGARPRGSCRSRRPPSPSPGTPRAPSWTRGTPSGEAPAGPRKRGTEVNWSAAVRFRRSSMRGLALLRAWGTCCGTYITAMPSEISPGSSEHYSYTVVAAVLHYSVTSPEVLVRVCSCRGSSVLTVLIRADSGGLRGGRRRARPRPPCSPCARSPARPRS